MIINKHIIINLRNHEITELEFNPSLNVIYGLNGAGKTTILESIAISSLSKSFMQVSDMSLIRESENYYQVYTEARTDLNNLYKIRITNKKGYRKLINSSYGDNLYPKEIIGVMPLVVLYPDNKSITFGGPSERRDFVDRLLSQASRSYMRSLMKYRKILKQRNNLLSQIKKGYFNDQGQLNSWTEQLLMTGAELIFKRNEFVNGFKGFFKSAYENVAENVEQVDLEYSSDAPDGFQSDASLSKEDISERLKIDQSKLKDEEFRRGTTMLGPQKDDFVIRINGGTAKEYASQGQHKSLLIALKFAEFNYLKDARKETPLILLDDMFSELDKKRSKKALEMVLETSAQAFVTATEIDKMNSVLPGNADCYKFFVEKGKVYRLSEQ